MVVGMTGQAESCGDGWARQSSILADSKLYHCPVNLWIILQFYIYQTAVQVGHPCILVTSFICRTVCCISIYILMVLGLAADKDSLHQAGSRLAETETSLPPSFWLIHSLIQSDRQACSVRDMLLIGLTLDWTGWMDMKRYCTCCPMRMS